MNEIILYGSIYTKVNSYHVYDSERLLPFASAYTTL